MDPIREAQWNQSDQGKQIDLRLVCTQDGTITMKALSADGYEQAFDSPHDATDAFRSLVERGLH